MVCDSYSLFSIGQLYWLFDLATRTILAKEFATGNLVSPRRSHYLSKQMWKQACDLFYMSLRTLLRIIHISGSNSGFTELFLALELFQIPYLIFVQKNDLNKYIMKPFETKQKLGENYIGKTVG